MKLHYWRSAHTGKSLQLHFFFAASVRPHFAASDPIPLQCEWCKEEPDEVRNHSSEITADNISYILIRKKPMRLLDFISLVCMFIFVMSL